MGKRKRKVKSIKKKKNNKIFSSLKKKKKMRGGGPPINMKTLQKLQGKFEMEDIPFDIQQYIKDPLSLQQPQVSSQVSQPLQVRPQVSSQVSSQQEVSNSNDKTKSSECISSPQSLGGNCNEDLTHIIDNICIKILNREDGPYLQYTFPLSHINKGTSDTFDFHNFLGEWTKNEKINAVIEQVIKKYNKHNPVTVDTVTSTLPDPLKVGVPSQGASAGGGDSVDGVAVPPPAAPTEVQTKKDQMEEIINPLANNLVKVVANKVVQAAGNAQQNVLLKKTTGFDMEAATEQQLQNQGF